MKQRVPHTGLRITTILVSMVVSVVTIILCCCVFVFLDRYRSAMVQSARTSSEQAVSQVSSTVESYLRDMDQSMRLVRQFMLEEPERRDELLSAFLKFRPDVVAVTSYSPEGELLECWAPGREPKEEIFQNLSFDLQTARAAEEPYIMAPHVESIFEGYYPWVVTVTAPIPEGGEAAWVSLDLSFSGISSYINNVSIGQRGYCFLMDAGGNIVYHPQQQLLYSGLKSENTAALAALADGTYADDTVISCLAAVGDSGWRIVGVSYVDELVNRNVTEMLRLSFVLAIVVLAASLLTSWLLSRLLDRPLRGLAAAMGSFEKDADHFTYRPVGGTREVQELSQSFGHMVVRIQKLMATVREEEVNLRKTELRALQTQINPHFLYNTLQLIKTESVKGHSAEVSSTVNYLSRFLRYTINNRKLYVTLSEEIDYIRSYVEIYRKRFPGKYSLTIESDADAEQVMIPKLTLQPIVENSVKHGLRIKEGPGEIRITVKNGNDLTVIIEDNGNGMDPADIPGLLDRIHHPDTTGVHVGLSNIQERLELGGGSGYGITQIESRPGSYFRITLKIRKGENYV